MTEEFQKEVEKFYGKDEVVMALRELAMFIRAGAKFYISTTGYPRQQFQLIDVPKIEEENKFDNHGISE